MIDKHPDGTKDAPTNLDREQYNLGYRVGAFAGSIRTADIAFFKQVYDPVEPAEIPYPMRWCFGLDEISEQFKRGFWAGLRHMEAVVGKI